MRTWIRVGAFFGLTISIVVANTESVIAQPAPAGAAAAAAPAAPHTLWTFLGIPQGSLHKIHGKLVNQHGFLSCLEKKPPLKGIADAANLKSDVPAVKKAAEIKQEEDKAKQKIKAIRYLAKIGCGCYDKDGGITEALLAALDDCTERVRYAAVKAILKASKSKKCPQCNEKNCCSEKVVEKLAKIAQERDPAGCWLEPSQRVRRVAAQALRVCCSSGVLYGVEEILPEEIKELPVEEGLELPESPEPDDAPSADDAYQYTDPELQTSRRNGGTQKRASAGWAGNLTRLISAPRPVGTASSESLGTVLFVDPSRGTVHAHLDGQKQLAVGTRMEIYHLSPKATASLGQVEVVESAPGAVNLRPIGKMQLHAVARGDQVMTVDNHP